MPISRTSYLTPTAQLNNPCAPDDAYSFRIFTTAAIRSIAYEYNTMNTANTYCTFYLDDLYFGIEVRTVQEVIRYQNTTRVPLASSVVEGLINLRGQIVTAIDLRQRLNLTSKARTTLPMNVVVRTADGSVSLLVDRIGDVVETDAYKFEPPPETLRGVPRELILGAFKLPRQLLLILDTEMAIEQLV